MDIRPTSDQSMSDDQELAKVLAGVSAQADSQVSTSDQTVQDSMPAPVEVESTSVETPEITTAPEAVVEPLTPEVVDVPPSEPVSVADGDLETIKKQALGDLRPLVDKLEVAPDEKFDTYLLLLRSTDDSSLIGPAYDAAKNIPDETRRAQALLDVIKEIDYLSNPQQS